MTPCSLKIIIGAILVVISCIQSTAQSTQVPMHQVGSIYLVDCELNSVPLKFIFDSGASTCQIGLTEALFLLKNGHLTEDDLLDDVTLRIADGSSIEGLKINIRSLVIGDILFYDVDAIVVKELEAPLLLGQNILSSNTLVVIDYKNLMLHFLDDERASFISGVIYDDTDYKKELQNERNYQHLLSKRLDSLNSVKGHLVTQLSQLERDKKSLQAKMDELRGQYVYAMQSNIVLKDVESLTAKIDRILKRSGKMKKAKSYTSVYPGPNNNTTSIFSLANKEKYVLLEDAPRYSWIYIPSEQRCGYILK
jgi:hypothetical protein